MILFTFNIALYVFLYRKAMHLVGKAHAKSFSSTQQMIWIQWILYGVRILAGYWYFRSICVSNERIFHFIHLILEYTQLYTHGTQPHAPYQPLVFIYDAINTVYVRCALYAC